MDGRRFDAIAMACAERGPAAATVSRGGAPAAGRCPAGGRAGRSSGCGRGQEQAAVPQGETLSRRASLFERAVWDTVRGSIYEVGPGAPSIPVCCPSVHGSGGLCCPPDHPCCAGTGFLECFLPGTRCNLDAHHIRSVRTGVAVGWAADRGRPPRSDPGHASGGRPAASSASSRARSPSTWPPPSGSLPTAAGSTSVSPPSPRHFGSRNRFQKSAMRRLAWCARVRSRRTTIVVVPDEGHPCRMEP